MDGPLTAMILAAGIGKRLRPITIEIPKALIEINGKSMILRHLEEYLGNQLLHEEVLRILEQYFLHYQ